MNSTKSFIGKKKSKVKCVLDADPEALMNAKAICSMFRFFYIGYDGGPVPSVEWNARADVDASKAFVVCGATIHYEGLDVTLVKLGVEYRDALRDHDSPLTRTLTRMCPLGRTLPYAADDHMLFDVVAVGMVLWSDLLGFRLAHMKVIDEGHTVFEERQRPNAHVGVSIQKPVFLSRFCGPLARAKPGRHTALNERSVDGRGC